MVTGVFLLFPSVSPPRYMPSNVVISACLVQHSRLFFFFARRYSSNFANSHVLALCANIISHSLKQEKNPTSATRCTRREDLHHPICTGRDPPFNPQGAAHAMRGASRCDSEEISGWSLFAMRMKAHTVAERGQKSPRI